MKRPAGFSGRPLSAKLGLKEGFRISLIGAPPHALTLLGDLPPGTNMLGAQARELDLLHLFVTKRQQLQEAFPRARRRIASDGMLWVSWPKRASGVDTDLSEDVIREVGLANGLVDVKVAAIDETWSGLKIVFRLGDRSKARH